MVYKTVEKIYDPYIIKWKTERKNECLVCMLIYKLYFHIPCQWFASICFVMQPAKASDKEKFFCHICKGRILLFVFSLWQFICAHDQGQI